jgi:hypothetical protein
LKLNVVLGYLDVPVQFFCLCHQLHNPLVLLFDCLDKSHSFRVALVLGIHV